MIEVAILACRVAEVGGYALAAWVLWEFGQGWFV